MTEKIAQFEIEKYSQDLTYVLFRDRWCSLCSDVWYTLKEIRDKNIPVYEVYIEKHRDLIEKYSIEEIPTVVVFRKGKIFDYIVGKRPKEKYLSCL